MSSVQPPERRIVVDGIAWAAFARGGAKSTLLVNSPWCPSTQVHGLPAPSRART